jgi:uncharacterized protein (TIGR02217 family)
VRVAIGGAAKTEGTDWTLNAAAGEVTFATAPVSGAVITAGFEFDVPVFGHPLRNAVRFEAGTPRVVEVAVL